MAHENSMQVSGIEVTISYSSEQDALVSEQEVNAYIARAHEQYPSQVLTSLRLEVEGEDVGIGYGFKAMPFDRIRRITGYLVGTMDRWNNAKTSEEHARVKHSVAHKECSCSKGC